MIAVIIKVNKYIIILSPNLVILKSSCNTITIQLIIEDINIDPITNKQIILIFIHFIINKNSSTTDQIRFLKLSLRKEEVIIFIFLFILKFFQIWICLLSFPYSCIHLFDKNRMRIS